MVTCKLIGQLGNQLFQIAATIGYAKKHNLEYCIPNQTLNNTWASYRFDGVKYCDEIYKGTNVVTATTYREPSHSYTEIPLIPANHIVLEGYFQSEKYFSHCKEDVLNAFSWEYPGIENSVSIHVRRGDYLLYPTKHPTVTIDYLNQSIRYFTKLGYNRFMVFSDDMPWCKENINDRNEFWFCEFEYSSLNTPLEDFFLMARCEHNIISNSTFSWWGAWLNKNPNKIVVSPSKENWFGIDNKHLSTEDLIPDNWVQIKY